ncbi:MAG: bifunctional heptose 7-phosphate kinase/heptose 1-phosphate adenyltransferase [Vicinamibacterales bacterium]
MTSLTQLASKCAGRRVAVIGDVMLDHFLYGRVDRISPEAPVPVVRFDRDEYRLGGAANVARNVAALGGRVSLVGLSGADEAGGLLARELDVAGIDGRGLVRDPARATTRKLRVVTSRNQQVARIDYEQDAEPEGAVLEALCREVTSAAKGAEALVLSDYRKGVVSASVIAAAADAATRAGIALLVDPKVPQADRYRGATLLTPNHHEAELMTQMAIRTPGEVRRAAEIIHERSGANVLVTWGELGMWLLDASRTPIVEEHLAAAAREVADVTGAGDTVIAVLALGVAAGARLIDAARLANLAAGLVVARFGPATVSVAELTAAAEAASR